PDLGALPVENDHVPGTAIERVVTLRGITSGCAEVAVVPGCPWGPVVVVPGNRNGAGLLSSPGRVVTGAELAGGAVRLSVVLRGDGRAAGGVGEGGRGVGGGQGASADVGGPRRGGGGRARADVGRLGGGVRAAAVGGRETHRVGARGGIAVARTLERRARAVAEVPRPGRRPAGGRVAEGDREGCRARGRRAAEGGHRSGWRGRRGGACGIVRAHGARAESLGVDRHLIDCSG